MKKALLIYILLFMTQSYAQKISNREYIYAKKEGIELKAYIFKADSLKEEENLPAIVIFHGGGWASGEAAWSFGRAEHFAKLGLVAIAAQYRISDQNKITPLEAVEDAKDIIIWIRTNKNLLNINPDKLAGYGWSAGAHLVTSAAIFTDPKLPVSSSPNVLILVSPAVSLEKDYWFQKLLLKRIEAVIISPDENVKKGLPPTLILQGREDTVTPLEGVQNFTDKMKLNGNICELIIYEGVGHLFTPSSEKDDGFPNPDKKIQANAYKKADDFLRTLGYIK